MKGSATHGETDVRDQNEKVNRSNPALSRKLRVAMEVVIRDVAQQEQGREYRRADHEAHVNQTVSAPDIDVSADQAKSAQRVECGIRRRQVADPLRPRHSALKVNKPNEETRNADAQDDNSWQRLAR